MHDMPKPMTADEQFTEIAERARRIGAKFVRRPWRRHGLF